MTHAPGPVLQTQRRSTPDPLGLTCFHCGSPLVLDIRPGPGPGPSGSALDGHVRLRCETCATVRVEARPVDSRPAPAPAHPALTHPAGCPEMSDGESSVSFPYGATAYSAFMAAGTPNGSASAWLSAWSDLSPEVRSAWSEAAAAVCVRYREACGLK